VRIIRCRVLVPLQQTVQGVTAETFPWQSMFIGVQNTAYLIEVRGAYSKHRAQLGPHREPIQSAMPSLAHIHTPSNAALNADAR
jgi:hypothetical protein